MSSFEHINYYLRPNKNVERKLIVESIGYIKNEFKFNYAYIGLGSMWFVDFILMHRQLGIKKLISIESKSIDRAKFNKPFKCVKIEPGFTTHVFKTTKIAELPAVVWLDYDKGWKAPVVNDLEVLAKKSPIGNIIIITLNADYKNILNTKDLSGNDLSPKEFLENNFKRYLPEELTEDELPSKYSSIVSKIMFNMGQHLFHKSGRKLTLIPLFNFYYTDSTPMVTIGFMVADEILQKKFTALKIRKKFDWIIPDFEEQVDISIPPLTLKEKIALDQMLPSPIQITSVRVSRKLKISLKDNQLKHYQKYSKHYPLFIESLT